MDLATLDRLGTKFLIGDDCWEWTASKSNGGYGTFAYGGQGRSAHRVVYELLMGPIPEGHELDHLCRNRGCVRPNHLEPVTRKENLGRGQGGPSRTHCPQGHLYDAENTYRWRGNGHRQCKTCRTRRDRSRGKTKE